MRSAWLAGKNIYTRSKGAWHLAGTYENKNAKFLLKPYGDLHLPKFPAITAKVSQLLQHIRTITRSNQGTPLVQQHLVLDHIRQVESRSKCNNFIPEPALCNAHLASAAAEHQYNFHTYLGRACTHALFALAREVTIHWTGLLDSPKMV